MAVTRRGRLVNGVANLNGSAPLVRAASGKRWNSGCEVVNKDKTGGMAARGGWIISASGKRSSVDGFENWAHLKNFQSHQGPIRRSVVNARIRLLDL
jgi:hypothetical protein